MNISLTELGNIGEFVSGVVVVVSLVYLAVQVKASTTATRFDSYVRAIAIITEHQKLLVNPEVGKIWLRGLADSDSLLAEERLGFYQLMYILMNAYEIRVIGPENATQNEALIAALVENPGFVRWWKQARESYSDRFRNFVDGHIAACN